MFGHSRYSRCHFPIGLKPLIMLISLVCSAAFSYGSNAQFAVGVKAAPQDAVTFGDIRVFDLSGPDEWKLERYGIGRGQWEFQKDRISGIGESRSGAFLASWGIVALGAELGAGEIGYHDRPEYAWEPAFSMGFHARASEVNFYAGPRAGYSYNNFGGNSDFSGWVVQIQTGTDSITYWKNNYDKGSPLEIVNLTLQSKFYIEERLQQNQKTLLFGVKVKF